MGVSMPKITIDELAVMVSNGFEQIEREFKAEFAAVRSELKSETSSIRADIRRLQEDMNEIKARLERLEKRTMEDDDALAKEVVVLRRRVDSLETELKKMKLAKA